MKQQFLDNIFEDKTIRTEYGTVTQRITAKRFIVQTSGGKDIIVDSETDWGIGTQVVVQNGFIIGTGSLSGTYREFKV